MTHSGPQEDTSYRSHSGISYMICRLVVERYPGWIDNGAPTRPVQVLDWTRHLQQDWGRVGKTVSCVLTTPSILNYLLIFSLFLAYSLGDGWWNLQWFESRSLPVKLSLHCFLRNLVVHGGFWSWRQLTHFRWKSLIGDYPGICISCQAGIYFSEFKICDYLSKAGFITFRPLSVVMGNFTQVLLIAVQILLDFQCPFHKRSPHSRTVYLIMELLVAIFVLLRLLLLVLVW